MSEEPPRQDQDNPVTTEDVEIVSPIDPTGDEILSDAPEDKAAAEAQADKVARTAEEMEDLFEQNADPAHTPGREMNPSAAGADWDTRDPALHPEADLGKTGQGIMNREMGARADEFATGERSTPEATPEEVAEDHGIAQKVEAFQQGKYNHDQDQP